MCDWYLEICSLSNSRRLSAGANGDDGLAAAGVGPSAAGPAFAGDSAAVKAGSESGSPSTGEAGSVGAAPVAPVSGASKVVEGSPAETNAERQDKPPEWCSRVEYRSGLSVGTLHPQWSGSSNKPHAQPLAARARV